MTGKPQYNWPDPEEFAEQAAKLRSRAGAAKALGLPPGWRDWYARTKGLPELCERLISGEKVTLGEVNNAPSAGMSLSSKIDADPEDVEALLRERNLDPEEWVVVSATVNKWESPIKDSENTRPLKQLKVNVAPKQLDRIVFPARTDGYIHEPVEVKRDPTKPKLVAFISDHQAPHFDPELHEACLEWLKEVQPDEGVILGDLIDLDGVSKYRKNPMWTKSVQETLDSGYSILRDYVQASPGTKWKLIRGNHDDRIRLALIDNMYSMYGVRRASADDETEDQPEVFGLSHLLRLDELGIEYVGDDGNYEHTQIRVSEHLGARHGWIAKKGSGSSALATLQHLRHSIVVGHTHRQGIVYETVHDIGGELSVVVAVECGAMCQVKGGLGYTPAPDWQQGFATATVWPDERFRLELATYVNGSLFWRDLRYDAKTI